MSVLRKTENRLNLVRSCHTCGRTFSTSAVSPWMRQITNVDGKKQKTCYFCSESCFARSYRHIGFYDGLAQERRKLREQNRDVREKNRRYYAAHAPRLRQKARQRYWENPAQSRKDQTYSRKKRALLAIERKTNQEESA